MGGVGEKWVGASSSGVMGPSLPDPIMGVFVHTCISNCCLCSMEITLNTTLGMGEAMLQDVAWERGKTELKAKRKLASVCIRKADQGA